MSLEQNRQEIIDRGFTFLENVIPDDKIDELREDVRQTVLGNSTRPYPVGHTPGFFRLNQALCPYVVDDRMLNLVESLFGAFYRISFTTGVINGAGIPRGAWHADWPYNQRNASHVPAPYPDVLMHLVSFWMLTDFTTENGGTLFVPGSHRRSDYPREGGIPADPNAPYPGEQQFAARRGTVAVMDARVWHSVAENRSGADRVAVIVRWAPWWLNLDPVRPGTRDRDLMQRSGMPDNEVQGIPRAVFETMPEKIKPLLYYSVVE
ncbi:MAG: phytanoyl-CoA dioxygenase family protein [Bryobacteraceae bacterium]